MSMRTAKTTGSKTLRIQSAALRRRFRALHDEVRSRLQNEPVDAIGTWQVLTSELTAWEKELSDVALQLRQLLERLEPYAQRQSEQLEARIVRHVSESGFAVHGETSPLIVEGIVHIEVDVAQGRTSVNGQPVAELTPAAVTDAVQAEIFRLRKAITPAAKMLEQLSAAYDQEIRSSGKPPGTQASTRNLLPHLVMLRQPPAFHADPRRTNFRDYPRELFRADLYTLLHSGVDVSGRRRLRITSGSDKSGAVFMLVPALQRTAHLGRIWFEEATS